VMGSSVSRISRRILASVLLITMPETIGTR
jgi:hypothetical protein